jgi:ABC-2 type transport system ATP-binding protein
MDQPEIGIKVLNLKKRLGKNQALSDITTQFEPATLHGIIGHDGAGKTTLLRNLIGLLHPDEGEIIFENHHVSISFDEIRPEIAYMPQQQSLYPDLSISEHLDFFRDLYHISKDIYRKRREELLRITRLEEFRDRPAGKLSGGMYKKLGLMCALLQSPSAVFLDEPTTGVDPISRREFWELLYRLVSQNILVLISTAYMDEAERCGKVHLLDSGTVFRSGEPKKLLKEEGYEHFGEFFIHDAKT